MKKLLFSLVGIACLVAFTAEGQLKYEDRKLTFNDEGQAGMFFQDNPYVSAVWRGDEHSFRSSRWFHYQGFYGEIRIMPGGWTSVASIGTNFGYLRIYDLLNTGAGDLEVKDIYQSSDARLKTDIQPVASATGTVMKLKPVTYRFANESRSNTGRVAGADGRSTGFLAQEVAQVLPNSVKTTTEGDMLVNYISLIPLLVKTVQEQQTQIEALNARIVKLEGR